MVGSEIVYIGQPRESVAQIFDAIHELLVSLSSLRAVFVALSFNHHTEECLQSDNGQAWIAFVQRPGGGKFYSLAALLAVAEEK